MLPDRIVTHQLFNDALVRMQRASRWDRPVMRIPVAFWDAQPLGDRRRVHELVMQLFMEVWVDGENIAFTIPAIPPINKKAHADRHRWLGELRASR